MARPICGSRMSVRLKRSLQRSRSMIGALLIASAIPAAGATQLLTSQPAAAQQVPNWSAAEAPIPSDAYPGAGNQGTNLNGVACGSIGICMAVGSYENLMAPGQSSWFQSVPLVDRLAGGLWAPVQAPVPPDANGPEQGQLNGVTCRNVANCVAVGQYATGSNWFPTGYIYLPGSSEVDNALVPSGAQDTVLNGVACDSSTSCVAVGFSYTVTDSTCTGDISGCTIAERQPLIETFNPLNVTGTEAIVTAQLPSDAVPGPFSAFFGIVCPQSGECVAVGSYSGTAGEEPLLEPILPGASPLAFPVVVQPPSDANVDSQASILQNIVCPAVPASVSCFAVGSYLDTGGIHHSLITEVTQPTHTTLAATSIKAPTPTVNADPNRDDSLGGLSCDQQLECVAVGSYTDTSGNQAPFSDVYDPSSQTWGASELPLPANSASPPWYGYGGTGFFQGADCPAGAATLDACVAVGRYSEADISADASNQANISPGPSDGRAIL